MQETYFGFEKVKAEEKTKRVSGVFESVAENYDIMNNLMSLGIHHLWKRLTIAKAMVRKGDVVLDLAGGTGDLSRLLREQVGEKGQVILADINPHMLACGRNRLFDAGVCDVRFLQANAETIPLADNSVDAIFIAFGLRNVSLQDKALSSMYRVCKPGGRIFILEFSPSVNHKLQPLYDWYSFNILPKLGKWIAQDEASYRYLAESIRMHPAPEKLKAMILEAGFEDCAVHRYSAGIVALHVAYKY